MRRHMHQMPRTGGQFGQSLCAGKRALRAGRGFHGVNVVVTGARMVGVDRQGLLEGCHDIFGPAFRFALCRPVIPRLQIHECLGIERAGCRIVRMALP